MKELYKKWIDDYELSHPTGVHGCCLTATVMLRDAFPELERVFGHVYIAEDNYRHPHWWCVDPKTKDIVDPTSMQFTILVYQDHAEMDDAIGKCYTCAKNIYVSMGSDLNYCSQKCADKRGHGEMFKPFLGEETLSAKQARTNA